MGNGQTSVSGAITKSISKKNSLCMVIFYCIENLAALLARSFDKFNLSGVQLNEHC